jgi:hypothetical protein
MTDEEALAKSNELDEAYARAEKMEHDARTFKVDFGHALWNQYVSEWQERHPDVLRVLREAIDDGWLLETGDYVYIETQPRIESRKGFVNLETRDGNLIAFVQFETLWDEPRALAIEHLPEHAPDALVDRFAQAIEQRHGGGGMLVQERIDLGPDPTVEYVLERVDCVEQQLLAENKHLRHLFDQWAKDWVARH